MRYFLFALIALTAAKSDASLLDYRVLNRNSVFCATVLTSTRASSTNDSIRQGTQAFRAFREEILQSPPVLTDGAVPAIRARADRPSVKTSAALARRIYSTERSFTAPDRNDEFVIATATFDENDFDRLLQLVRAARDAVMIEAKAADRPSLSPQALWDNLMNLNQYFMYGQFFAVKAASFTLLSGILSATWLTYDPLMPKAFGAYGLSLGLATVGSIDYPIRHVRSYQHGFQSLAKALKKFRESDLDWTYWSRDVVVSPEYAQELLASKHIRWDTTLRDEDFREQASGLWRLLSDRKRRRENRPYVNFSIDVLARKIDGHPQLTIVLRSQPVMTPQTATQTSALPNAAAGHAL